MASKVESITNDAFQLSSQERVEIIEKLLVSLESVGPDDYVEVQASWEKEIRHRSEELRSGAERAVPWTQVRSEGEQLFDGA